MPIASSRLGFVNGVSPRAGFLAVLAISALFNFVCASIHLPVWELFSDAAIHHSNHTLHLYHMGLTRDLAADGLANGYDPTFGAGYLGGLRYNGGGKMMALIGLLFSPLASDIVIYKAYVFVVSIAGPLFPVLAARLLGCDVLQLAFVALLASALWWASPFIFFTTGGMPSATGSEFIGLYLIAHVVLFIEQKRGLLAAIAIGLAAAFLFLMHPHFAPSVGLVALAFLAFNWKKLTPRTFALLAVVVPIIALLPNAPWMVDRPSFNTGYALPHHNTVFPDVIWSEALGQYGPMRGFFGEFGSEGARVYTLIVLGLVAALFWARGDRTRFIYPLVVGGIALTLLGVFGPAIEQLRFMELNRQRPVAYLLFAIPAAIGLAELVRRAVSARTRVSAIAARGGIAMAALLCAAVAYELQKELNWFTPDRKFSPSPRHYGVAPPQAAKLDQDRQAVLDWIAQRTDKSGRILFETMNAERWSSMTVFFAHRIDREYIGGPFPHWLTADFFNGRLFGKPLTDFSDEALKRAFDAYNIRWIVTFNDASATRMAEVDSVRPVGEAGIFRMHEVTRSPSFVLHGSGQLVEARTNSLIFDDLSGEDVIVSYNYHEALISTPPAVLSPASVPGAETPFIRIQNPPKRLELRIE